MLIRPPSSAEGSTKRAAAWALDHGNARRRNGRQAVAGVASAGAAASRITACAIVPLYPNELTPPHLPPPTHDTCAGKAHPPARAKADATCGLSDRSCAFGDAPPAPSDSTSSSSPVIPAAGSAWPMFALMPPTASFLAVVRCCSTAIDNEPVSIGSPSAVPVPCASLSESAFTATPPSESAAERRSFCACPFGAVKLALRPSCRTALPQTSVVPSLAIMQIAPQASLLA
eukprot:2281898-Prymnesium_polylepis.3